MTGGAEENPREEKSAFSKIYGVWLGKAHAEKTPEGNKEAEA